MENTEIDNRDVAEPDQVVSGTAVTGQENEKLECTRGVENA